MFCDLGLHVLMSGHKNSEKSQTTPKTGRDKKEIWIGIT